jgi:hypothetical protein
MGAVFGLLGEDWGELWSMVAPTIALELELS